MAERWAEDPFPPSYFFLVPAPAGEFGSKIFSILKLSSRFKSDGGGILRGLLPGGISTLCDAFSVEPIVRAAAGTLDDIANDDNNGAVLAIGLGSNVSVE